MNDRKETPLIGINFIYGLTCLIICGFILHAWSVLDEINRTFLAVRFAHMGFQVLDDQYDNNAKLIFRSDGAIIKCTYSKDRPYSTDDSLPLLSPARTIEIESYTCTDIGSFQYPKRIRQ